MSLRDDFTCHQEFEREWERQHRVYGMMMSVKTLKVMKQLAKCVYLQGRMDGMAYVLEKNLEHQLGRTKS